MCFSPSPPGRFATLGRDQDEGHDADVFSPVGPIVDRPSLNHDIARFQMDLPLVQFHPHLSGKTDAVVNGIRSVPPPCNPGFIPGKPKNRPPGQTGAKIPRVRIILCRLCGKFLCRPHGNVTESGPPRDRFNFAVPFHAAFSLFGVACHDPSKSHGSYDLLTFALDKRWIKTSPRTHPWFPKRDASAGKIPSCDRRLLARHPNTPPIFVPVTRLITKRQSAPRMIRIKPRAAASFTEPPR